MIKAVRGVLNCSSNVQSGYSVHIAADHPISLDMSGIAFGYAPLNDEHIGCFSRFGYQILDVAWLERRLSGKRGSS